MLFIAATAVGFLMSDSGQTGKKPRKPEPPDRGPSEFLQTGSALLFPPVLLFGVSCSFTATSPRAEDSRAA